MESRGPVGGARWHGAGGRPANATWLAAERLRGGGRAAIVRLVVAELDRVRPRGPALAAHATLDELGVDGQRFLDAVNRIEGQYEMRFRDEWLARIRTCGDLVDCIATHMIDRADDAATGGADPGDANGTPEAGWGAPAAMPLAAPRRPAGKLPHRRSAEGPGPRGAVPAADPFPECGALEQRLAGLAAQGLEDPFRLPVDAVHGRSVRIRGRSVVNFTSFDYLGLAGHPAVTQAAKQAIDRYGCSASASRMVGGNSVLLDELDEELAAFIGTERAVVFPCGYGTNASLFAHLFGAEDLILYDELAHNSIVQGATASKAGKRSFRHNDHRQLDRLLRDLRGQYRRVVVAIEGVYSMDGDYPDLPRFIEVKRRHDALLYVDEAHSLGTMGPGGRGLCEFFDVDPAAGDLWMGTISKALGAGGGFLAGSSRLIHYLGYTTPAFVFSTACSPPNAAAALESLRVIRREPWRVTRLRERSELFLKLAADCDLDTGPSADTPVIPVILGSSDRAIRVSQRLLELGINARPILYPAVREVAARVRFFLTCEHTEEQIADTVATLAEVVRETAPAKPR
ncbi:MAG: aminotransferase class I/II-fold pyridoxal phosphate-dependent enzyme [Planctomycetia bacterium]|nr:aminotransferase class I/II-fold pyridoxal phosphate-dependent enzyme [Planctomycetia bacterium]